MGRLCSTLALALVALAGLGSVGGCSFDKSGLGGNAADSDSGLPVVDAGPCPEAVHVVVTENGVAPPGMAGVPAATGLLGDVIALSAAGSCVQHPPMTITWTLSPSDTSQTTFLPSMNAQDVTFLPLLPENYLVTLTVTDGSGQSGRADFFGVAAHGFQRLDSAAVGTSPDVRSLTAGPTELLFACDKGVFEMPLTTPGVITDLGASLGGDTPPADLTASWLEPDEQTVWAAPRAKSTSVYRGDLILRSWLAIDISFVLGGSATVRDIDTAGVGLGVRVAADLGVTEAPDDLTFVGVFRPATNTQVFAVAEAPTRKWGAGAQLFDLANPAFAGSLGMGDAKVRAMTVDAAHDTLWLAGDNGMFEASATSGTLARTFGLSDGIPSDTTRAVAVESTGKYAGDAWFATDMGVVRFSRARGMLIPMGPAQGLASRTNDKSVAVDETAGRRAIYVGTSNGLVYIHDP